MRTTKAPFVTLAALCGLPACAEAWDRFDDDPRRPGERWSDLYKKLQDQAEQQYRVSRVPPIQVVSASPSAAESNASSSSPLNGLEQTLQSLCSGGIASSP
jgi:hypothetical protein